MLNLKNFQETDRYTNELVKPILICMSDADSRVRYYACESLYNVTKGKTGTYLLLILQ